MKYVIDSPATFPESLALDEAMLEDLESCRQESPLLRFWTASTYGAVLGYSNRVASEVDTDGLAAIGGAVYRRTSGGGTVLIGPGCLNYSLVLRSDSSAEFSTVSGANRAVMAENAAAIEKLGRGPVSVRGHTDLVWRDRKFCGNAQRRKQNAFLFHGSILLSMDLEAIETALQFPSKTPDYREDRSHLAFVINFDARPQEVMDVVRGQWGSKERVPEQDVERWRARASILVQERYGLQDWRFKY